MEIYRAFSPQLRLCAIDVGSNSIKMRIVEGAPGGTPWQQLAEARYPVRLGNSFRGNLASQGTIAATLEAFVELAGLVQKHRVHRTRVVATSALREMKNASELCDAVRLATGLEIEVISGLEEARLLALGIRPDCKPGVANLIMDVGGGSTELILATAEGRISYTVSLPLGAVRLRRTLPYGDPPTDTDVRKLCTHISETLDEYQVPELPPGSHVIGVAGTVNALVHSHQNRGGSGSFLRSNDIADITRDIIGRNVGKLVSEWGLDERRAEVILPGALIVQLVMQRFGSSSLVYSVRSLRDGILSEMIQEAVQ